MKNKNLIKMPALYRVLDATTNRGREAIRVIEDVVRFICNDGTITAQLKSVRHEFTALTNEFSREERLKYRATEDDVGTSIQAKGEYFRQSLNEVLAANFSRFQESLRSLEEFAKMAWPNVSINMEHLRYLSYTLEKDVFARMSDVERQGMRQERLARLRSILLYVAVDASCGVTQFRELLNAGVGMIQLRDEQASDSALLALARKWQVVVNNEFESRSRPLMIMNRRADLALLADFDGVHLNDDDLSVHEVRTFVGNEMIVGQSGRVPDSEDLSGGSNGVVRSDADYYLTPDATVQVSDTSAGPEEEAAVIFTGCVDAASGIPTTLPAGRRLFLKLDSTGANLAQALAEVQKSLVDRRFTSLENKE
ncbi:MAG: thiamine phosphate synthase [Planctomycetia bacterium]|nr:thiamine phosphate synthase [Planctomycetia bacterium]